MSGAPPYPAASNPVGTSFILLKPRRQGPDGSWILNLGTGSDSALNKFNPSTPCPGNNCYGDSEAEGNSAGLPVRGRETAQRLH